MRRLLRGVRRAGSLGASAVRVGYARLAFPGVTITSSVLGPGCEVYAAQSIGPHSVIVAREHGGLSLRAGLHRTSSIHIGPDVWLGAHPTVLRGVRVGAGATVGAGAVVTHDVAPGSTVAGIPAVAVRRAETSRGRS
ncbi:MAG TPA: DapH/DapD/GlmU-related protein [Actinophytocola sp.]|nr:DapH/DapD/GlmU-related protein [Actinophytocola sp.]